MIPTSQSANGISGHLLRLSTGDVVFRVYDQDHNFVDYDLAHHDLSVTIHDADAFFYRDEYRDVLDHAPATLGRATQE